MLPNTYKEYLEQENKELGQEINRLRIDLANYKNKISGRNMQIKDLQKEVKKWKNASMDLSATIQETV